MKQIVRIVGSALIGLMMAAPVQAETLTDALIAAYRNSNLLEQNRAVLRAADEGVAQAVAQLRPLIALNAQGGYLHNQATEGLTASLSLTAELTIYDFGRNAASVEAAKQSVLATRQALIGIEQDVLLAAVTAYVGVRQQQDAVALRQANVRLITQELRAANDRFDVGEITRTDVAIADARLAQSRSALATAEGDLNVARENFKLAVGVYPRNLARPPASPKLPRTLAEAREIALRTHPDIKQLQHEVATAEANVVRAKADYGPTLTGRAELSDGVRRSDSASITLRMSQTLYAGGQTSSLLRQAMARRDIARAQLNQISAVVALDVAEAWSDLSVAFASIQASDREIRSAQTAYDGVREEAKLGARTTLDVLNAEQELLSARTARLSAEAIRYSGVYALLASMGLLTVDHLRLGIPTYDASAYYNAVKNAPATSAQGKKLDRILKSVGGARN